MMPPEIWRPVADAYGYEVSNLGRVRSWRRKGSRAGSALAPEPKLLKTTPGAWGYPLVNISRSGDKQKPVTVHILVLTAFCGPCPNGMECLHADGDRTNSNLSNLYWGTRAENMQDSIRHGTSIRPSIRGEQNMHAELTQRQVIQIKRMLRRGVRNVDIARIFNVHPNTIWGIKSGGSWEWLVIPGCSHIYPFRKLKSVIGNQF